MINFFHILRKTFAFFRNKQKNFQKSAATVSVLWRIFNTGNFVLKKHTTEAGLSLSSSLFDCSIRYTGSTLCRGAYVMHSNNKYYVEEILIASIINLSKENA